MNFRLPQLFPLFLSSMLLLAQRNPKPPSEAEKAIEEFRIQTRTLTGSVAANRPKSVSGWHGRLYENFRNDALDAVPHEVRQAGQQNSLLRRNQFGSNVSGPMPLPLAFASHKTYISLSFEGVRQVIDRPNLATIATLRERTGDFSATVDSAGLLLPIYDPATTRPNPCFNPSQPVSTTNLQYLRDPFPDNQIPANRLDPVALAALKDFPAPNVSIGPFFQNNYFVNTPETDNADGGAGRVETELTQRNRLIANLSLSNGLLGAAALFPSEANPGPIDHRYKDRRAQVQHIFTASANITNSFAFAASSVAWNNGQQLEDNPAGRIGLGGVGADAYPYFQLSPYLAMGQALPYSTHTTNSFTATDALSYHRGKHQLELDLRHSRFYVNNFAPPYPAGTFAFSPGVTSLPGIDDTGLAFASFLLGMPYLAQLTTVVSPSYFLRTESVATLRDQYQPLRQLTVNIAVNLTRTTPRTEKYNRQTNVDLNSIDPATGQQGILIAAGMDGVGRGLQPVRVRGEPSIGIAWNLANDSSTVFRAGYSRSYQAIPIGSSQSNTQGYNSFQVVQSPNAQLSPALTLATGFPADPYPLPYLGPDAANNSIADYLDPTTRQPVYQAANLSLERSFGSALVTAGVTYGGGKDVLVGNSSANPDALPASELQYGDQLNNLSFAQSLRPYPQFLNLNLNNQYPIGRYQRDTGFVRLDQRAAHGMAVYVTYVYSKQMDNYSGPYGVQDFFSPRQNWSLTPSNRPKTLQADYTWKLPLGRGRRFLNYSDWRDDLAQGWSASGSASVFSGTPIVLHPLFNNTGGVANGLEVDAVPGVNPHVPHPSPALWYNPAAFAQPADFTLGNVSRADPALRNPMFQNYDLSVEKRFVLDPQKTLAFGAVALNFLNHANWNNPDPVIGSAASPNLDAGKIIGSTGGRIVQLTMRLTF